MTAEKLSADARHDSALRAAQAWQNTAVEVAKYVRSGQKVVGGPVKEALDEYQQAVSSYQRAVDTYWESSEPKWRAQQKTPPSISSNPAIQFHFVESVRWRGQFFDMDVDNVRFFLTCQEDLANLALQPQMTEDPKALEAFSVVALSLAAIAESVQRKIISAHASS